MKKSRVIISIWIIVLVCSIFFILTACKLSAEDCYVFDEKEFVELRKENIDLNIPVVFSKEDTIKTENMIGSCVFVPAVAGIYLANYVFLDIMKTSI